MDRWKALFWGSFIPLLSVQGFVLLNERYWTLALADITLHFMWGYTIFIFFVAYLRWQPKDALLGVVTWQIIWELTELLGDWIFSTLPTSLHFDPFFFDGISDTLVNIGGALVGWLILHFTGEPLYERRVQMLRAWFILMAAGVIPLIIIGSPIAVTLGRSPDRLAIFWIAALIPLTLMYALLREPRVLPDRRMTESTEPKP